MGRAQLNKLSLGVNNTDTKTPYSSLLKPKY